MGKGVMGGYITGIYDWNLGTFVEIWKPSTVEMSLKLGRWTKQAILLMKDVEPEQAILYNQARLQWCKHGTNPASKPLPTTYLASKICWSTGGSDLMEVANQYLF